MAIPQASVRFSIGLSGMSDGITLTTMLQEVQSLVNLRSDEITCGLCAYDGNYSTHLPFGSDTEPD